MNCLFIKTSYEMVVIPWIGMLLLVLSSPLEGADEGNICTTPYNISGTCVEIKSCKTILNIFNTKTDDAIRYIRKSECGFSVNQPLVCCEEGNFTFPPIFQHSLLPKPTECGFEKDTYAKIPKLKPQDESVQLFGQSEMMSYLNYHPWVVLLQYLDRDRDRFLCGGSLISSRYVLTAAHCIELTSNSNLKLIGVRLGENTLFQSIDCEVVMGTGICGDPVLDSEIAEVVVHPLYQRETHLNDIALIRLVKNVTFTDFIQPICLPMHDTVLPVYTELSISGWGETGRSDPSDIKLYGALPVLSPGECRTKFNLIVQDQQICAGRLDNVTECRGDSGGPAMRMVQDELQVQWVQEGIMSYGAKACAVEGFPSVYVRVSKYVDWIVQNLSE